MYIQKSWPFDRLENTGMAGLRGARAPSANSFDQEIKFPKSNFYTLYCY